MMRKLLFSAAAAATAIALGSPAFAQAGPQHSNYPPPPAYGGPGAPGWGQPGYGRGHHAQARELHQRVEQLRRRINQLHRMHRLSGRDARRLDRHAIEIHRRIDMAAQRGINRRTRTDLQHRIEGLRHAISYQAGDGNSWGWDGHGRSDNAFGYYGERHRDDDRRGGRRNDRDDRWERDRN